MKTALINNELQTRKVTGKERKSEEKGKRKESSVRREEKESWM
jgi:hypothetical protein